MRCVICQAECKGQYKYTCSKTCHEIWLVQIRREYGNYQKVVRISTGEAFKVPTALIYEQGIKEQELNRFPLWQEGDSKFDPEEGGS